MTVYSLKQTSEHPSKNDVEVKPRKSKFKKSQNPSYKSKKKAVDENNVEDISLGTIMGSISYSVYVGAFFVGLNCSFSNLSHAA